MGAAALLAVPARAAETDAYYAWYVRVPDGTRVIDDKVNAGFAEGLREVNRCRPEARTCSEVALHLMGKQFRTAVWFAVGATRDWHFPYRPATTSELLDRYAPVSMYRYFGLQPYGVFVDIDPTINVAGVTFGTDKMGHFFTNGPRYWNAYERARAAGKSVDDALRAAVDVGIRQESGILGGAFWNVFSYGDMEANFQGLELMRSWCEGPHPGLVFGGGRWRLARPFRFADWVNPCWNESFYPTVYSGPLGDGVKRALPGYCRLLHRPDIVERRRRYRAQGCSSFSVRTLDALMDDKRVPDPTPFTIESVCGDPPLRVRTRPDAPSP